MRPVCNDGMQHIWLWASAQAQKWKNFMGITGTCLCGAVTVTHACPEKLVRCNCSACRRYGTVWAHGETPDVAVVATGAVVKYARSDADGDLTFVSCAQCGVTTHWEQTTPKGSGDRMAINAALCDPATTAHLPLRHFDGAESWSFLD